MKALVTGGAGFIGHHLVRGLVDRGHDVTVLDDLSTGSLHRLESVAGRVRLVTGSILDRSSLDTAVAGADAVFHLAAIASVARSMEDPRGTDEVNVGGTIEVAEAAARHGVARVVFAGSSAVYGDATAQPCRETQRAEPTSPYGVSKLAAELYLHSIGAARGFASVSLRYFNVFGPGQDPASEYAAVVPRFVMAALSGERPTINGSGEISRDFVFVNNVVTANLLAATAGAPDRLSCNIASGSATTLLELLGTIASVVGRPVEPVLGPPRAGDILHSRADIALAERQLGFHIDVPFAEGIALTVARFGEVASPA